MLHYHVAEGREMLYLNVEATEWTCTGVATDSTDGIRTHLKDLWRYAPFEVKVIVPDQHLIHLMVDDLRGELLFLVQEQSDLEKTNR